MTFNQVVGGSNPPCLMKRLAPVNALSAFVGVFLFVNFQLYFVGNIHLILKMLGECVLTYFC